jgi:tRNA pseudouridine55 synthase
MRRLCRTKKVGHLGTLDPMATGVLPLLLGGATRLAQFYTGKDKIYEAVIRFGFSTDTYDAEGTPVGADTRPSIKAEEIEGLLEQFRGEILQTPPAVSAKKIGGVRAYKLARQGLEVPLEPARVQVYQLELLEVAGPDAVIRARCSAGTYMRSMAHDLGRALGCGAHLKSLRRLASAEFDLSQSRTVAQLEQMAREDRIGDALIPAGQLLPEIPDIYVDENAAADIRHGRDFPVPAFRPAETSRLVKALDRDGQLIAVAEARLPHLYHPVLVLAEVPDRQPTADRQ